MGRHRRGQLRMMMTRMRTRKEKEFEDLVKKEMAELWDNLQLDERYLERKRRSTKTTKDSGESRRREKDAEVKKKREEIEVLKKELEKEGKIQKKLLTNGGKLDSILEKSDNLGAQVKEKEARLKKLEETLEEMRRSSVRKRREGIKSGGRGKKLEKGWAKPASDNAEKVLKMGRVFIDEAEVLRKSLGDLRDKLFAQFPEGVDEENEVRKLKEMRRDTLRVRDETVGTLSVMTSSAFDQFQELLPVLTYIRNNY
eukprot:TRINITY_DN5732_c0_g2_i1.p1 TRINITY_DN5732_c0_g2~~TRINITY_DN5732_c0_g2_i1.p1  ORF type:complete len:255 (+),score=55.81 TRINITY_DN5732_c0_g2_i1:32-796(+)